MSGNTPPFTDLEATSIVVSAHGITNIPKSVQQVDPSRSQFMLVVTGLLRFVPGEGATPFQHFSALQSDESGAGSGGTSTTSSGSRELPHLNIPFSPANVMFRDNKFSLKLDTRLIDHSAADATPFPGEGSPPKGNANCSQKWTIWRGTSVPADCISILDIFVGVLETRGSSNRWVTSPPHALAVHYEKFAISAASLARNAITTKVIGTSFGQVTLSFTVSDHNSESRLKRLDHYLAQNPTALSGTIVPSRDAAAAMSELEAMTAMRKAVNPNYYIERVLRYLAIHTEDQEVVAAKIAELQNWAGREEFFMRNLIMEFGPDVATISPKRRLQAFMRVYRLQEQDVQAVTSGVAYDREPEKYFALLVEKFGKEPSPARYCFPVVNFEVDPRACLLDHLAFPANKPGGKNSRDVALTARAKRKAFTNSPLERETEVRVNRRQLTEIEILQQKHEPEFTQIIPSVADALQAVIDQHAKVKTVTKDDRFAKYDTESVPKILLEDYVHRIAEYTFISPASMIGALIFMDRICERHHSLLITERNVFKMFFISVRVASKVIDVRTLNNKNFAQVGGVNNRLLNDIEETFLKHLKFDLFVGPAELMEYTKRLNPPLTMSRVPRGIGSGAQNAADQNGVALNSSNNSRR